jgi:hypothetical protein
MAKTTVKKKAPRPRSDALLDAAAKERRRLRTLVNAKREIARLALQLRGAQRRANAALLLLATDIVEAEGSRLLPVQESLIAREGTPSAE